MFMFNYKGGFSFKSNEFICLKPLIQPPFNIKNTEIRRTNGLCIFMYFYGDFCHLLVTIKFSFMRKFLQNPCVMLLTHRNMPQLL